MKDTIDASRAFILPKAKGSFSDFIFLFVFLLFDYDLCSENPQDEEST